MRENIDKIAKLEQENLELRHRLMEAEEANSAKSRFLSNMSHDIRTPMNAIVGMTSIGLSHIDEKARVQDCLNKIQTASSHLMSLINDVLDMSRIDSDRMILNEEVFSLADLIHDVSVIVRPQASQKNQTLRIEIEQICEETLLGDSLRLRQIIVNIIGNAVKYTPADGQIHVLFTQSQSSSPDSQDQNTVWLNFQCQDNGIGMSADFLKRIFVPFERVHNEMTRQIEGTGLGMSIVKRLVDSMQGQITVESEEGVGSCFRLALPLSVAPQDQSSFNLPAGQTVMLVDKQKDLSKQVMDYLRSAGMIPVHSTNGLDAVTILTEAKYEDNMPCALLLGQELEDIPPLELAAHVRQLAGQELPIVLISEADWAQLEYPATRAGINAFVPCPLFESRLLKTLSDLIGGSVNASSADRNQDYSRYHVLLAEDMPLNQEIAVELLSVIGVQVEVADDGAQAVELFAASPEHHFSLIFMDIHMPNIDGYEATRQIRALDRADAESVWIVAMTADAFVEDVRQATDAGMNEHISKPIDPERLQEILCRQLSQ